MLWLAVNQASELVTVIGKLVLMRLEVELASGIVIFHVFKPSIVHDLENAC